MEIEIHISSSEENSTNVLTINNVTETNKELMLIIRSDDGTHKSIFILKEHLRRVVEIFKDEKELT